METLERGVLVLNLARRIKLATARAQQWVTEYFGRTRSTARLPEALERWVHHQEARLARADDAPSPREPLVVEREGRRLVVRLVADGEQRLLLLDEEATRLEPAALALEPLAWIIRER